MHSMKHARKLLAGLAGAMVLTQPLLAQTFDDPDGGLDCTIEPRTIAEIGSPEEGIIDAVHVRRGDQVSKGQVLAVLDSTMERLTVDQARVQAQQDVEVRTGEARLAFQTLEREWRLHQKMEAT